MRSSSAAPKSRRSSLPHPISLGHPAIQDEFTPTPKSRAKANLNSNYTKTRAVIPCSHLQRDDSDSAGRSQFVNKVYPRKNISGNSSSTRSPVPSGYSRENNLEKKWSNKDTLPHPVSLGHPALQDVHSRKPKTETKAKLTSNYTKANAFIARPRLQRGESDKTQESQFTNKVSNQKNVSGNSPSTRNRVLTENPCENNLKKLSNKKTAPNIPPRGRTLEYSYPTLRETGLNTFRPNSNDERYANGNLRLLEKVSRSPLHPNKMTLPQHSTCYVIDPLDNSSSVSCNSISNQSSKSSCGLNDTIHLGRKNVGGISLGSYVSGRRQHHTVQSTMKLENQERSNGEQNENDKEFPILNEEEVLMATPVRGQSSSKYQLDRTTRRMSINNENRDLGSSVALSRNRKDGEVFIMPSLPSSIGVSPTLNKIIEKSPMITSSQSRVAMSVNQEEIDTTKQIHFQRQNTPCAPISGNDDTDLLEHEVGKDQIINIEIKSSDRLAGRNKANDSIFCHEFCIPVSLVIQREKEMRAFALSAGIPAERWNGSLLIRKLKAECIELQMASLENMLADLQLSKKGKDVQKNTKVREEESAAKSSSSLSLSRYGPTFVLDPEFETAGLSHLINHLVWTTSLTKCITSYYKSGVICVPDDASGNKVLFALEYFGILFSPDQLAFDSFGCYLHVKLWSDYYIHRESMVKWVMKRMMTAHSRHSHAFVTFPEPVSGSIYVGNKRCELFDGGLMLDPIHYEIDKNLNIPQSCTVVHDFFNKDDNNEDEDISMISSDGDCHVLREDFCVYLQSALPGTSVKFLTKEVKIVSRNVSSQTNSGIPATSASVIRSVLYVDFNGKTTRARSGGQKTQHDAQHITSISDKSECAKSYFVRNGYGGAPIVQKNHFTHLETVDDGVLFKTQPEDNGRSIGVDGKFRPFVLEQVGAGDNTSEEETLSSSLSVTSSLYRSQDKTRHLGVAHSIPSLFTPEKMFQNGPAGTPDTLNESSDHSPNQVNQTIGRFLHEDLSDNSIKEIATEVDGSPSHGNWLYNRIKYFFPVTTDGSVASSYYESQDGFEIQIENASEAMNATLSTMSYTIDDSISDEQTLHSSQNKECDLSMNGVEFSHPLVIQQNTLKRSQNLAKDDMSMDDANAAWLRNFFSSF